MATKFLVRCTYINQDTERVYGEDDAYVETDAESMGEVYRFARREYGRCISKIYDEKDGNRPCGWVFLKREEYSDNRRGKPDTYLQETWVHVRTEERSDEEQERYDNSPLPIGAHLRG